MQSYRWDNDRGNLRSIRKGIGSRAMDSNNAGMLLADSMIPLRVSSTCEEITVKSIDWNSFNRPATFFREPPLNSINSVKILNLSINLKAEEIEITISQIEFQTDFIVSV
jgi:hypothetical protein